MTVFAGSKSACPCIIEMKNNINEKTGYGRADKKKKVRGSYETHYAPRSTRRTSILLDLGPTPRTLLFPRRAFFFHTWTRDGPAVRGPTSTSGRV